MMNQNAKRQIEAYLAAFRAIIDPHRALLNESSPYILTGGSKIELKQLISGAAAAAKFDADLIHLEFTAGEEASGPINLMVGMSRTENIVFYRSTCRLWLDPCGAPSLIASDGRKHSRMNCNEQGMDSNPGKPSGSLEKGFARADAKLKRLAADALAARPCEAMAA